MSKKTYRKKIRIWNMSMLVLVGGLDNPIYWRHKFMHPGWWKSMTFRTLEIACNSGILWTAEKIEEGQL